jgi:hypothetical protein
MGLSLLGLVIPASALQLHCVPTRDALLAATEREFLLWFNCSAPQAKARCRHERPPVYVSGVRPARPRQKGGSRLTYTRGSSDTRVRCRGHFQSAPPNAGTYLRCALNLLRYSAAVNHLLARFSLLGGRQVSEALRHQRVRFLRPLSRSGPSG